MPFEIGFEVATVLLVFQLDAGLGCVNADWQYSFDHPGWSVCPNSNTYLKGLWRHDQAPGDERIGRIEFGKCCPVSDQTYANHSATCSNANWVSTLYWWANRKSRIYAIKRRRPLFKTWPDRPCVCLKPAFNRVLAFIGVRFSVFFKVDIFLSLFWSRPDKLSLLEWLNI